MLKTTKGITAQEIEEVKEAFAEDLAKHAESGGVATVCYGVAGNDQVSCFDNGSVTDLIMIAARIVADAIKDTRKPKDVAKEMFVAKFQYAVDKFCEMDSKGE